MAVFETRAIAINMVAEGDVLLVPRGFVVPDCKTYGAWALARAPGALVSAHYKSDAALGNAWMVVHAPSGTVAQVLAREHAEALWWWLAMQRTWWPWSDKTPTQKQWALLAKEIRRVLANGNEAGV